MVRLLFVEIFSWDGEVLHVVEECVVGSGFELFADLEAEQFGVSLEVADLSFVVDQGLEN